MAQIKTWNGSFNLFFTPDTFLSKLTFINLQNFCLCIFLLYPEKKITFSGVSTQFLKKNVFVIILPKLTFQTLVFLYFLRASQTCFPIVTLITWKKSLSRTFWLYMKKKITFLGASTRFLKQKLANTFLHNSSYETFIFSWFFCTSETFFQFWLWPT